MIPLPTKSSALYQAKYELKTKDRISRDILIDAEGAKILCEKLCITSIKERAIEGYIQIIYQDPFGLILISEIQVIKLLYHLIFYEMIPYHESVFIYLINRFIRSKCGLQSNKEIQFGISIQPVQF